MAEGVGALTLQVNGQTAVALAAPSDTLLTVLRDRLGLTGAKRGCDQGVCGACTVMIDGAPVRACLSLAVNCSEAEITTVEGIAGDGPPSALQRAFIEGGALQCGFCTPGMIVTLTAFLKSNTQPDAEAVRGAISGNLCRCTGYSKIVRAALAASGHEGAAP